MIDFEEKDWFRNYLKARASFPVGKKDISSLLHAQQDESVSGQRTLYQMLQPTGFLYGFPVDNPFHVHESHQDQLKTQLECAKFVILECLFGALILHELREEHEAQPEHLDQAGKMLLDFFLFGSDPQVDPWETFDSRWKEKVKVSGSFINKPSFGINSLIFWDLYYLLWFSRRSDRKAERDALIREAYRQIREKKILTIRYLIAAAWANDRREREEIKLFSQFLKTSGLDKEDLKTLKQEFKQGLTLNDIQNEKLGWIGRRYLLDLCLLIILSDRTVGKKEEQFLEDLREKLQLDESELEESSTVLGIFMMRHGHHIPFLKSRINPVRLIGTTVKSKALEFFGAVRTESVETRDMAVTFGKMLRSKLNIGKRKDLPSEDEIKAALDQLKDIPRFAPFFSVAFFPMPGITELYLFLSVSVERMSGGKVKLLPSNFSKMLQKEHKKIPFSKLIRDAENTEGKDVYAGKDTKGS